MHGQPIGGAAAKDDENDSTILDLLLLTGHPVWAVEELQRELGDGTDAVDAVNRLRGAGLAHRLDGFVFASRAAAVGQLLD